MKTRLLAIFFLACGVMADTGDVWYSVNNTDAAFTWHGFQAASVSGYAGGDMHYSKTAGSDFEFNFIGTGVRWMGARNTDHGQADVYMDGVLDSAGLDTWGMAWFKQQVLYQKTGLTLGVHVLRVVLTGNKNSQATDMYQDVDAAEYLAPPPPPLPVLLLNATQLPDLVPHVGPDELSFFGNGRTGAGGDTRGQWDFLIGPDYTSPDFISRLTLHLKIDSGPAVPVSFDMFRVRGTGMLSGQGYAGDLAVYVVDFSAPGSSRVERFVRVANLSASAGHRVSVEARFDHSVTTASVVAGKAVLLKSASGASCFGGEATTRQDRWVLAGFSGGTLATVNGAACTVVSATDSVGPGQHWNTLLQLEAYFTGGQTDSGRWVDMEKRSAVTEAEACLLEWQSWTASGKKVGGITLAETDLLEGAAAFIRMQQDVHGGFIATPRRYCHSYIRDSHGACRGLMAMGHTVEARRFLQRVHINTGLFGYVCNSWQMWDTPVSCFYPGNSDAELPGYYVMMLRDYLAATRDTAFVDSLRLTMENAVDAQLNGARSRGWRIRFNGDETERYTPSTDGATYGTLPEWSESNWSLASSAMAEASGRFYCGYLRAKNETGRALQYESRLDSLRNAIDSTFLLPGDTVHAWARKTNATWFNYQVPNFCLLPLWAGAKLNRGRETTDALAMRAFSTSRGFLPTAPGANDGLTGHALGYLLYDLTVLNAPEKDSVYRCLLNNGLMGCWGTWTEFYGPSGTSNGHNLRVFETGINLEAMVRYHESGLTTAVELPERANKWEVELSAEPNPFNPACRIHFQLKNGSPIRLAVYDVAGRCVDRLAGGWHSAGSHTAVWDAGGTVGSGIYLVRLVTGHQTRNLRITLLR